MNRKNSILILVCAIGILLIYSIDLFKLNYRLKEWNDFGSTPVEVAHVQYFIADTPNMIGYTDPDTHETVSCELSVAYVTTNAGDSYRCCDTGEKISCLQGDFSKEIPASDEACTANLQNIFGAPTSLAGTKQYTNFGDCTGGKPAALTVVQLDNHGRILWKSATVEGIQMVSTTLRCIIGPLLLLVILWIILKIFQEKRVEPIRELWKSDNQ